MRAAAGIAELTPASALLAEAVRRYSVMGDIPIHLQIHQLCWFLSRMAGVAGLPDRLGLTFSLDRFGPYAECVWDLLDALQGGFLRCETWMRDGRYDNPIWFDYERRQDMAEYLSRAEHRELVVVLDATERLLDGYESAMGLELLGSVDWLVVREGCSPTVDAVMAGMARWPAGGADAAARKVRLMTERLVRLGLERLGPLYRAE